MIGRERSGGRVLAVFQMTSDIGAILGPVLVGLLADRLGYGWAFGGNGGVLLVAALGWLAARETIQRPGPAGSSRGRSQGWERPAATYG